MVNMHDTLSAQVAVIGSLLLEPKLLGEALLKVSDKDFISSKCRMVFQAMRNLFNSGEPADPVTVRDKLGGHLEDEWSRFLMDAMDTTPTAANLWIYVDLMKTQARLNQLNQLGALLQVTADLDSAKEYISKMNAALCECTVSEIVTLQQGLADFMERIDKPREYVTWGIEGLDNQVFAERGDFVIIGGRPSAGKTALSIMFGLHMAKKGLRVGFFSLETGKEKYFDRLVSHLTKVSLARIKQGIMTDEDVDAITESGSKVNDLVFDFIHATNYTVDDIQSTSLASRYDVIFIDYVQLIHTSGVGTRNDLNAEVSRSLHRFSQTSQTLVVALSQLSRAKTTDGGVVAPNMASLRESGQYEQDADIIMLLYLEDESKPDERRILKVAKNKEGTKGKLPLEFDGNTQTFRRSYREIPPPKRREHEYKQTTFTELSRHEPVPFEGAS